MSIDKFVGRFCHPDWLESRPLGPIVGRYVEYLQSRGYANITTSHYLSALAHFNYWAHSRRIRVSRIDRAATSAFVRLHLPTCRCPRPCFCGCLESSAALRHVLALLVREGLVDSTRRAATPVAAELDQFRQHLTGTCGLSPSTCWYRSRVVGQFLDAHFGIGAVNLARLSPEQVDAWVMKLMQRYRPGSLGIVRSSLRSYFRYRALNGDSTESLSVALPTLSYRGQTKLVKTMTDAQLRRFLRSFDLRHPTDLRDRAMAHCLSELGLRGQEVTHLTLDDIDWRSGTVTLRNTKSPRVRVLPLPAATGAAIAAYLRNGRPRTGTRQLFVSRVAPFDQPLTRQTAASAMNRAFTRSGLRNQFSGTHVLRRTLATRMQRRGSSLKEIADLLGHLQLQTASRYAQVDFKRLRRIALPWAGRQP